MWCRTGWRIEQCAAIGEPIPMRCWRDTYALRFGRRGARWFAGEESLWIRNTLGAEQILLQVHPESLRTKRNGVRLVEAFPLEVHGLPDVHGGLEREELKQAVSAVPDPTRTVVPR